MGDEPRICDYGDSTYRQDFWEGRGRQYEDAVERRALARLLPAHGTRLLEIGAGFGRLTSEYHMFEQVVLLDYSLEQLQYARGRYGDSGFVYVAADAYRMPFCAATFDAATMVRVIHHFEHVPAVLRQIRQVLADDAFFLLEYANKRNLKAMLRHLFGRNGWNPYSPEAVEFVELNYNFHPKTIEQQTAASGFALESAVPLSWLRLGILKRALPTSWLVALDALLQRSGWSLAPSEFLLLRAGAGQGQQLQSDEPLQFLRCPQTGSCLQKQGQTLQNADGTRWAIRDGVYDFRRPLA